MFYTYILKSQKAQSFYIGFTENLKQRLTQHNQHVARYSSSKALFTLVWYCAFITKKSALDFERYLKSSSGSAFRNKHLI